MGDFNSVVNNELDRSDNPKRKSEKQDPLIKWLTRQKLCDIYRMINSESREFS